MGLIKAALGAIGGTLADQWKEFFYCESMSKDVLMVKGQKQITGRSSNTKGNDNIISNGSGIAVADGQCMLIVEQGKIVEVCAEPGQFTYDTSTEPSIFAGKLGKSILETFKTIGKRIAYGGDTGKDQRVYYINIKEILDNKFGTPNPVPFRVVDSKIGLDIDVSLRCSGVYTFKIADPLLFYTNVCGNVKDQYLKNELESTMKAELLSALQPALARLSEMELRPNQIMAHNTDLRDALKQELSTLWGENRGIEVVDVAPSSVTLPEEDQQLIKDAQRTAMYKDPGMAGAKLVDAQSEAMVAAANNDAGAMTGFMGMGMAMNAGGGVAAAQNFYTMSQQQQQQQAAANSWKCSCGATSTGNFCTVCGSKKPSAEPADSWKCPVCGKAAAGNFCTECGAKKPVAAAGWTCSCGAVNKGKFCPNCGAKKPESEPLYRCDKCGWEPADPKNPPKFCPNCGDIFDSKDIK